MKISKNLVLASIMFILTHVVFGQGITTSGISGKISDKNGNPLPGATVVAVHEPTGSQFGTISRTDGGYNLPNIQTGGPYSITVSFVGYKRTMLSEIRLVLGEDRIINMILREENISLDEVVVTKSTDKIFNSVRKGTTVNITSNTAEAMPGISRSINDLTRLTPQSNGTSFAGRDNRFNNYTIDGMIYNNNFGSSNNQFAGGNPLSLDAIEEVQVSISPYDVNQGGFSGANVNTVTKRGGNLFKGTVYSYYRNQNFTGKRIGDQFISTEGSFNKIYGGSLSGRLIKDKIFFFFNIEKETRSNPGITKLASRPGLPPDGIVVSRVPADTLEYVRMKMKELYGYETGDYEKYNFANGAYRLNLRFDFNIKKVNKLMVRFNHYKAFEDGMVNGNALAYNPVTLRYSNTSRAGIEAMNFRNSHYSIDNNVSSIVSELNSIINSKMANNLRIGYNMVTDPVRRVPGGQNFPFIEIVEYDEGRPLYYMTLGNELFSVGSELSNNIFNITDNFSFYTGDHNLTLGINYEYMTFSNGYNPVINGLYRYSSYSDFKSSVIEKDINVKPELFLQGYSFKGGNDIPMDKTAFGQYGIYIQDKIQVVPKLDVVIGLRADIPFYPVKLPENVKLDSMNLAFIDPITNETVRPDVSFLPPARILFSPRIGFNYNLTDENKLQIRGGTGIFTGRIPFVWISNQVNGNGVTRGGFSLEPAQWGTTSNPSWDGFHPEVNYYRPDPGAMSATVSKSFAITGKNFKLPQVWRSNLAVDYIMPFNIVLTIEGIYTKDFNSPIAVNINSTSPSDTVNLPYAFPYWSSYYSNTDFTDVIMLTNINKGYYASLTSHLTKDFGGYGSASIAYTRSISRDFGLTGGAQASSLWAYTVVNDRNNPEPGYTRFDMPNRIIAHLILNTRPVFNPLNLSIGVYYEGRERGRFSYTYAGSFGDGADRLMYIPKSFSDSYLIDKTGPEAITAAAQWEILDNYIRQDPYLRKHRGEVAERNGAKLPWLNRFDIRISSEISIKYAANIYRIQIYGDILNFGHMLNNKWGVGETYYQKNLLSFKGIDDLTGNAMFTLNTISGTTGYPEKTYKKIIDTGQTWVAQLGLRFLFN